MANKKISELTRVSVPTGISIIPIVFEGTTRNISLNELFTYVDNYYNISGVNPGDQTGSADELGYTYKQFRLLNGNLIVSGADVLRLPNGVLYIDKTGYFKQLISGSSGRFDNIDLTYANVLSGLTVSGDTILQGNLTVSGALTYLESEFQIEDKNIILANYSSGFLTNDELSGAGITIRGLSSDKNITWKNIGNGAWVFDEDILAENNLSVSGDAILNQGLEIRNSSQTNKLSFGPNINVYASGNDLNTLATNKNIFVEGTATINQPLILSSNAIVSGDIYISGNTTLGDASGDTTTFRSKIGSNITPTTTNTYDLGSSNLIWRRVYADSIYINNDFTATGNLNVTGNTTLGDSTSDSITFNARAASSLIPNSNDSINLGSSNLNWSKVYSNEVFVKDKLYVTGDLINGGNLTVTGNLNITGNTKLGDSTSDTITFTARSNSNLVPSSNNSVDLGSNDLNWRTSYVNDAYIKNNLNTSGNIFVGSNLDVTGNISVSGNLTIGDNSSDIVSVRSRVNTNIEPSTNNSIDLGSNSLNWRTIYSNDAYVKNNLAVSGNQIIAGNSTITGNLNISGNTTIGDNTSDTILFTARSASNLVPDSNNTRDLGQNNLNWRTIYADNQFLKTNLTVSGDTDVKGTLTMQGSGVALSGVLSASGNYLFERISTTGNSLYERENSLSGSLNQSGYFLTTKIDNLSGVTLLTYGNQLISGNKTFINDVTIGNLFVTGTRTIFNTDEYLVESPYLLLNVTGGTYDGGIFFVTGLSSGTSGAPLTGANAYGPIIGFDHSNNFVFGVARRSDDINILDKIAAIRNVNDVSGALYLSGMMLSGTFNTTGWNLFTGINNVATNLRTTGDTLIARTDSLSGNLNSTGWNLFTGINNIATNLRSTGDTLTSIYLAASGNLNTTGYSLNQQTLSLSGSLNLTGLNLSQRNDSLSGFLLNNYVNLSGNATISGIKNFLVRPTLSGQGLVTLDQVATVDNTLLLTDISQTSSGDKNFLKRITISGVPILISGDSNIFYTTGFQNINSDKVFSNNLGVSGIFTGSTGIFRNALSVSGNLFTSSDSYISGDYINFKNLTGTTVKSPITTGTSALSLFSPEFYRSTLRNQDGFGGDFTYQPSFADKTNIFSLRARSTTLGYMQPISSPFPYVTVGDINLAFSANIPSGAALTGMVPGWSRIGASAISSPRNLFDSIPRFSMTGGSPGAVINGAGVQFGFSGSGLFNGPGSNPPAVGGSTFQFIRGTGDPYFDGYGGFYFKSTFGLGHMDPILLTSLSSGYNRCSAFIGMWGGTCNDIAASAPTSVGGLVSGCATIPSGTANKANIMGIGFNSGDKFWSFVHNDNIGVPTYINLGPNYPTYIPSGYFIQFSMVAIPNSGAGFYATILGSGNNADISYLTYNNLPIANAPLSPNISFGLPGPQSPSGFQTSPGVIYASTNSLIGASGSLDGRSPILEACINNLYIESFL